MQRFEADLESIHASLSKSGTQKKYGKTMERIGRLKQRYGVGNCYAIEIDQEDGVPGITQTLTIRSKLRPPDPGGRSHYGMALT